jgi:hypothetical protein
VNTTRRILAAAAIAAAMAGIAIAGFGQVEVGSSGQAAESASSQAVEFRLPARGAVASGTVEITLETNSSVARASIFIDGVVWKSSAPNSFDWNSAHMWFGWNSASVSNGKHAISVSAFDGAEAEIGRESFDITVRNQAVERASDTAMSTMAVPAPVDYPGSPGNQASSATGNRNLGGVVRNTIKTARPSIAAGLAMVGGALYAPPSPTPNLLALQPAIANPSPTQTHTSQSGMPLPPTLNNPQNPINYGADPTGVNDSYPAFKRALAVGDLDIHAGKYKLVIPTCNNGGAACYTPPSGRKILCENPYSSLPATPSSPVVITIPQAPSKYSVFYEWKNAELYGCEFEGSNYPKTTWSGGAAQYGIEVIQNFRSDNVKVYGNGFDGWPGFTGAILVAAGSYSEWRFGQVSHNYDISYNRASACDIRFVEPDFVINAKITHNTLTDCPAPSEIIDSRETGESILEDSNHFTFVHGVAGGTNSGWLNYMGDGATCHGPNNVWPCAKSAPPADYSGNTFSNNIVDGPVTNWIAVRFTCMNNTDQIIPGVYINNTCTGGCKMTCPPGNANGNSWGRGSNQ